MLVDELVRAAARRLEAAGVRSPRVDAELLACAALGVERPQLALRAHEPVDARTVTAFEAMLVRREAREPLQHIVTSAPFRHLLLHVGPGVFVPRPETELLVDAVLAARIDRPHVIDLCSGSGALAIAIATEAAARVTAVESSASARRHLARNVAELAPGTRVLDGDVTDPDLLADRVGTADVVVCNPPYVPEGTAVEPEVLADPPLAVFAGADGLAVIRHVIPLAARLLHPGGLFVMEHDDSHGESVPALLRADGRWHEVTDHNDLAGRPRFVVALRS